MLNSLYNVFLDSFSNHIEAWDKYLEFIAADHSPLVLQQLNHKFEWLLKDSKLVDKIFDIYQPHLLQEERYDYLGEIYRDHCIAQSAREHFLIPHEVAQAESIMTIGKTDDVINILEPQARTGRHILTGYELAPNARYFGVESNLKLARITLTNMLIHNINGFVLHANRGIHEIEIEKEMGIHNWKYSNRWYSQIDKLKPKLVDMPKQNRYK